MSLQWRWDDTCGEATFLQEFDGGHREFTTNLYNGNALLIFVNEWEEEGRNMYSLYAFFANKEHAKICLGLDKKRPEFNNMFDTDGTKLVSLKLNKEKCRDYKKIVSLFKKAFPKLNIENWEAE